MADMRQRLRGLKSLSGPYQPFDTEQAPAEPIALFAEWLQMAIDAGTREPHAMTLSTVDAEGNPDARVLILKNVDEHGWHFAITRMSPKGRQIEHHPRAALTFYWPLLARQVRIRGRVRDMGPDVHAADFLARPLGARAGGLVGRQSDVLAAEHELDDALAVQLERLRNEQNLVAPHWVVHAVEPASVEFWQGSEERRHTRLRYLRAGDGWSIERLWP